MGVRNDNWLTGPQQGAFRSALSAAYTLDRFDQLLLDRLDKVRANIALGNDATVIVGRVIDEANRQEWAHQLLGAALAENPQSRPLLGFAASVGYDAGTGATYESVVKATLTFVDVAEFRERLAGIEIAVCQVAFPGKGGTGTLVGPDLVLTNYHVIEDLLAEDGKLAKRAECIFDFKRIGTDGRTLDRGRRVKLADDWHIKSRPPSPSDDNPANGAPSPDELDFALIRLAEPVGEQPLGNPSAATPNASTRGWIDLSRPTDPPAKGALLFIVQHPQMPGRPSQEPMQITGGNILEEPGLRVRYDTPTHHGSSGSLCFNGSLEPVALHHMGDPSGKRPPRYNQGIPLAAIAGWLAESGTELPPAPGA